MVFFVYEESMDIFFNDRPKRLWIILGIYVFLLTKHTRVRKHAEYMNVLKWIKSHLEKNPLIDIIICKV